MLQAKRSSLAVVVGVLAAAAAEGAELQVDPSRAPLASLQGQYRQIDDVYLSATYLFTVVGENEDMLRVATGQLKYWASGASYRFESTMDPSLRTVGLMGSQVVVYDGFRTSVFLPESKTLIRDSVEHPRVGGTPNPLYLPLEALSIQSPTCAGCPISSLAEARGSSPPTGWWQVPSEASGSGSKAVAAQGDGAMRILRSDPSGTRSQILYLSEAGGSWRVESLEHLDGSERVIAETAFGAYRTVPGTEPRLALPHQIRVSFADDMRILGDEVPPGARERLLAVDIIVTELAVNRGLKASTFHFDEGPAETVIDNDANAVVRAPRCESRAPAGR